MVRTCHDDPVTATGSVPTTDSTATDSAGTATPGPTGDAIRVLVADDHVLYRRGLELVLGQEADIEIVGEAGDGAEAIVRAEELLPDVVLMDVRMPVSYTHLT